MIGLGCGYTITCVVLTRTSCKHMYASLGVFAQVRTRKALLTKRDVMLQP